MLRQRRDKLLWEISAWEAKTAWEKCMIETAHGRLEDYEEISARRTWEAAGGK